MSRSKSDSKNKMTFTFPSHDDPDLDHDRAGLELHFESGSNSSHGSVPIVAVVFRHVDRVLSIEPISSKDVASLVLSIIPPKISKFWNLILRKVTYDIPFVATSGNYNFLHINTAIKRQSSILKAPSLKYLIFPLDNLC